MRPTGNSEQLQLQLAGVDNWSRPLLFLLLPLFFLCLRLQTKFYEIPKWAKQFQANTHNNWPSEELFYRSIAHTPPPLLDVYLVNYSRRGKEDVCKKCAICKMGGFLLAYNLSPAKVSLCVHLKRKQRRENIFSIAPPLSNYVIL